MVCTLFMIKSLIFLQVLVLLANVKQAQIQLTIFIKIRKIAFWEEHVLVMTNARLCPIATLTQVKTCNANYFMKNISRWYLLNVLRSGQKTSRNLWTILIMGVDPWPICTLGGRGELESYPQKLHIKIFISNEGSRSWVFTLLLTGTT